MSLRSKNYYVPEVHYVNTLSVCPSGCLSVNTITLERLNIFEFCFLHIVEKVKSTDEFEDGRLRSHGHAVTRSKKVKNRQIGQNVMFGHSQHG